MIANMNTTNLFCKRKIIFISSWMHGRKLKSMLSDPTTIFESSFSNMDQFVQTNPCIDN